VKLLDFGLAKLHVPESQSSVTVLGALPTAAGTAPLTTEGMLLGTFQYMAPEQLEGREADTRSDIFALGTVIYEMVSGRKAFAASSQASVIGAIMTATPPPMSSIVPFAPPLLDRLVSTCLEKDPDDRIQTAHDVLLQLRWIQESSHPANATGAVTAQPLPRRSTAIHWMPWAVAAVATVAAGWLALSRAQPRNETSPLVVRSTVLLPERVALGIAAISPQGDRIVFSGEDQSGRSQLWMRPLDNEKATRLAGTEGGIAPFWSPDGTQIGFVADRTLKRVDAAGGVPVALSDVDATGGAWTPAGDILFAGPSGPMMRISAGGGGATAVTALDTVRGETSHRYPFVLPDGRHFLFLAMNPATTPSAPVNQICVGSVEGGPFTRLLPGSYNPLYAGGFLLFLRGGQDGGSLIAQPFDAKKLVTTGAPVTIAGEVAPFQSFADFASVSVSQTGTLLYDASRLLTRLEFYDRSGRLVSQFGEPALRGFVSLSPDATRAAYNVYDASTQTSQVWIADLQRGVETRLTSPPGSNATPIWSPDGQRVAYQSDAKHQADILIRAADGSGVADALTDEVGQHVPRSFSVDGRTLIAYDREPAGDRLVGITAYAVDGSRKPYRVVPRRSGNIAGASLSPDGRWLAYDADESGKREVVVVSFPEGTRKVQISNAGGADPRWTKGGRELLYDAPDHRVMSVAVQTGATFQAASAVALFVKPEGAAEHWDVTPDGERFVFAVAVLKSSSVPLTLVQNWQ
jgi:Tol biopolymer transport system component